MATSGAFLALLCVLSGAVANIIIEQCCTSGNPSLKGPCVSYTHNTITYARDFLINENLANWWPCDNITGWDGTHTKSPISFRLSSSSSALPPGILLNTTDGRLYGTPTQYAHRASLLIIPTDSDGNDGVAVSVILSVGPGSKPENLTFLDINPRPRVYSGNVIITPGLSETNFTHYATYFTKAPDFIDQSMFDPAISVNGGVVSQSVCAGFLFIFDSNSSYRCPGPFEYPASDEYYLTVDWLNPQYVISTAAVLVGGNLVPGPNFIFIHLIDNATTLALARNITFQDTDAGLGEYGGLVTITPPESEAGVVKYGLFFANRVCVGAACTITLVPINITVPLAGSTGVVNVTIPANTMVTANSLAVYTYGASTMSTDALFVPLVDFAPGSANVTILGASSGSILSSPEFTIVVNVSRPISTLSPSSFAVSQSPANAVNVSATIAGSGSLWYINVTIDSLPTVAQLPVNISLQLFDTFDYSAPRQPVYLLYQPPTVIVSSSVGPSGGSTRQTTIDFVANFSAPVSGVSASDFGFHAPSALLTTTSLISSPDNTLWTLRVAVGGGFVSGNLSVAFTAGSSSAYPPFLVPSSAPFVITFDNVPPVIHPPVFTPPAPANVTTGDVVTITVTTDSAAPVTVMTLLLGGNSTSTPVLPLSKSPDNTSFVFTYTIQATDPIGPLGFEFSATDAVGNTAHQTQLNTGVSLVAKLSLSPSPPITTYFGQPIQIAVSCSRQLPSLTSSQLCLNLAVGSGNAVISGSSITTASSFTCTVTASASGPLQLTLASVTSIPGVAMDSPFVLNYTVPAALSAAVVMTNSTTPQLPAPVFPSTFPFTASLVYSWSVVASLPSGVAAATFASGNSSQSSPVLSSVTLGSSHTVTVTITDPSISPATTGSTKVLTLIVNHPNMTPLSFQAVSPAVISDSNYTILPSPSCIIGRSCEFAFTLTGFQSPEGIDAAVYVYLISTDPSGDVVSKHKIGGTGASGTSIVPIDFHWSIPGNSTDGGVKLEAVALIVDPVSGDQLSTGSLSGDVTLTSAPFVWAVTAYSSCSSLCDEGWSTRDVNCYRVSTGAEMPSSFCPLPPPVHNQTCFPKSCNSTSWRYSAYGPCSHRCGGGSASRTVECVDSNGTVVADSACPSAKQPLTTVCNTQSCAPFSIVTTRSSCNATCGSGQLVVFRTCLSTAGEVGSMLADCNSTMPAVSYESCTVPQSCSTARLVRGVPSLCMKNGSVALCGFGQASRTDSCVNATTGAPILFPLCSAYATSPTSSWPCASWTCPSAQPAMWMVGPLGECVFPTNTTPPCYSYEFGTATRTVQCVDPVTLAPLNASLCDTASGFQFPSSQPCKSVPSASLCDEPVSTPLISRAVATFSCPNNCSGVGSCQADGCHCFGSFTGAFCEQSSSCVNGVSYNNGQSCCKGVLTLPTPGQTCCEGDHATLDRDGNCCASGLLDAAGICDGHAKTTDALGKPCDGVIDGAGICCEAPDSVDLCGICKGNSSSCAVNAGLVVSTPVACSNFASPGTVNYTSLANNMSNAVVGAIDTRIYTGSVTAISCPSGPTPMSVQILLTPVQASVYGFLDSDLLTSFVGGLSFTMPQGSFQVSSVASVQPLPVCGNAACEFGERCIAGSTSPCCPGDCPYFGGTCPTSDEFKVALTAVYGSSADVTACSGRGYCSVDPRGQGTCVCFAGYIGVDCSFCAPGFTKRSGPNGLCESLPTSAPMNFSPPNRALGDIAIGAISLVAVAVTVAAAYVIVRLLQKPKVPLSAPANQV